MIQITHSSHKRGHAGQPGEHPSPPPMDPASPDPRHRANVHARTVDLETAWVLARRRLPRNRRPRDISGLQMKCSAPDARPRPSRSLRPTRQATQRVTRASTTAGLEATETHGLGKRRQSTVGAATCRPAAPSSE